MELMMIIMALLTTIKVGTLPLINLTPGHKLVLRLQKRAYRTAQ